MKAKLHVALLWALSRAQERTTWTGLMILIGALAGHQLDSGLTDTITNFGVLLAGGLMAYEEK